MMARIKTLLWICGTGALVTACRGEGNRSTPDPPRAAPEQRPAAAAVDTPTVVGRWRGPHDELELFRNGRLLLHQGAYRVAGSYDFVEPGRVLLVYQNALALVPTGDYRVAVTADSLRLCETDAPARCLGYARIAPRDPASVAAGAASASRALAARDGGAPPRLAAPQLAEPLRPDQYPPDVRAREADGVLKQAYTLQQAYRANYGHYAVNMDSLRSVGWEAAPMRFFRAPRTVSSGDRLCISVQPRMADGWPMHIDERGRLGRGARCR